MSERINYIILFVGKRGCGKTTTAIKIAESTGKRILVVNTDNNDAYKDFEIVPLQNLITWKGKKGIVITTDALQALEIINQYQKNIFVICDDTQKYIGSSVEKEARNFIINHRMNNIDVVFMYHTLKFVPPYIAMQFNQIVLFKTTDTVSSELKNKYSNFEAIANTMANVKAHQSPYYCEIVKDNE